MAQETVRESGACSWFNDKKGFGFLTRDNGEKDVFVHFSAIKQSGFRTLREGQRVTFTVVEKEKGLQAADVEIVS